MDKFMADVDVNHPYAGKTLTFEIEIADVGTATNEELAHRHVHGTGGHHH
jgi:FKBP-type peptidyl-prolyl cis-trans isomerase SlyD